MTIIKEIKDETLGYIHARAWLERWFVIVVAGLGFVLTGIAHSIGFLELALPKDSRPFAYLVVPAALLIIWIFTIQIYLRSGRPPKIGITYIGYEAPESAVRKMRQVLFDRHRNGHLEHLTSLRFVPEHFHKNERARRKFVRRYKLSLLVQITQSRTTEATPRNIYHLKSFHLAQYPNPDALKHIFSAAINIANTPTSASTQSPLALRTCVKRFLFADSGVWNGRHTQQT